MAKQCLDCGKNIPEYMTYCPQCGDKRGIKTTVVKTNTVEPEKEEPGGRCNLITAYIRMFKKYSTMQGRSRRSEYWYVYITDSLIKWVLYFAVLGSREVVEYIPGYYVNSATDTTWAILIIGVIYRLATEWAIICLTVRRLHDVGKRGWWCFLKYLLIGEIVLAIFLAKDSQVGKNIYGPDPKAGERNKDISVNYSSGIGNVPVPNKEIKESEIEIKKPKVIEKQ